MGSLLASLVSQAFINVDHLAPLSTGGSLCETLNSFPLAVLLHLLGFLAVCLRGKTTFKPPLH